MLENEIKVLSLLSRFPYFDKTVAIVLINEYFQNIIDFKDIEKWIENIGDNVFIISDEVVDIVYAAYCDFDFDKITNVIVDFINTIPKDLNDNTVFKYIIMNLGMLLHSTEYASDSLNMFTVYVHSMLSGGENEFCADLLLIIYNVLNNYLQHECDCGHHKDILIQSKQLKLTIRQELWNRDITTY